MRQDFWGRKLGIRVGAIAMAAATLYAGGGARAQPVLLIRGPRRHPHYTSSGQLTVRRRRGSPTSCALHPPIPSHRVDLRRRHIPPAMGRRREGPPDRRAAGAFSPALQENNTTRCQQTNLAYKRKGIGRQARGTDQIDGLAVAARDGIRWVEGKMGRRRRRRNCAPPVVGMRASLSGGIEGGWWW
jgi:hypothetical protein